MARKRALDREEYFRDQRKAQRLIEEQKQELAEQAALIAGLQAQLAAKQ